MINEKVIKNKLREKNKLFVYGEGSNNSGKQVKYLNDFLDLSGDRILMSMNLIPLDLLIDLMIKFTYDPDRVRHEEKLRLVSDTGYKAFSSYMSLDACTLIKSDDFRNYLEKLYFKTSKKEEFKDFVKMYRESDFDIAKEMEYESEIEEWPARFDDHGIPIFVSFCRKSDSDEKIVEALKNLNLAFNYIQLRDIDSNLSWDNYSTLYDSIITSDQFKDLLKEVYRIATISGNTHRDFSSYKKDESQEETKSKEEEPQTPSRDIGPFNFDKC